MYVHCIYIYIPLSLSLCCCYVQGLPTDCPYLLLPHLSLVVNSRWKSELFMAAAAPFESLQCLRREGTG